MMPKDEIYEGKWKCSYCLQPNDGDAIKCASCNRARSEDAKWFLPEDAPQVTDPKEIAAALAGPDWTCDHCKANNVATENRCSGCGNERTVDDKAMPTRRYAEGEVPRTEEEWKSVSHAVPSTLPEPSAGQYNKWLWGLCAVAAIALLALLLIPRSITATVESFSWERTVDVQLLKTFTEEDWSVPSGGRVRSQGLALHHFDQVLDHYETAYRPVRVQTGTRQVPDGHEDLGNGKFRKLYRSEPVYTEKQEAYKKPVYRQQPVFRTKYTYDIDRWTHDRYLKDGANNREAVWPVFTPQNDKEKGIRLAPTYTVFFQRNDGKGTVLHPTDEEEWLSYTQGENVTLKLSVTGILYKVLR